MKKEIKVSDMSCMTCMNKIKVKLAMGSVKAKLNFIDKNVLVDEKDYDKALVLIKEAGYTVAND